MIDLENLKQFTIARPSAPGLFGTAADFDNLPGTHREQILFLDKAASEYLFSFTDDWSNLLTGGGWDPFAKGNFRTVETYPGNFGTESKDELKKWLYQRGIPFKNWVFLLTNTEPALMLTWKMVVKYAAILFGFDDTMVFDHTLNWCLFYYHEDRMFFGKENQFDGTENEAFLQRLNERKKKYPQFRHPFM